MGRPPVYHTPEEKRAAHNEKSRKNYAKNKDIIRVRRIIRRERKNLIENLELEIKLQDLAAAAAAPRARARAGIQHGKSGTKTEDADAPAAVEIDHEKLSKWSNGLMTTKHLIGSLDPAHMRAYVTYLKQQQQRRQYNREQRFKHVVFDTVESPPTASGDIQPCFVTSTVYS